MMKTIKPFIDLGWHTVPLEGELKRLSNGKKTLPMFPSSWNTEYAKNFNKKATALGGALTGTDSGIIAIDCDDTVTYNLFKALDPDYKFHFVSAGKQDPLGNPSLAGTIVYSYSEALAESFHLNTKYTKLDFYSNGGFIYLPTQANATKEPFTMCELKPAPPEVVALLQSLRPVKVSQAEAKIADRACANNLAPQVEAFVKAKKVLPQLFRVLTPKDFRDLPEYIEKQYLAPVDVCDGRGSEYLSKVSAILGADSSIDEELYINAMELINDLFDQPMPKTRLSATIIEPMVEERASINGKPIWQYDENWQEGKLQLVSKRNAVIEAFYDPTRMAYYLADVLAEESKVFSREQEFCSHIETIAVDPPSRKEVKTSIPLVDVVSTPAKPFGFYATSNGAAFNTFAPTIPLAIFREPALYEAKYSRPEVTLQFLETLIPDIYMRNYLIKFLRRKLDKFEYSPVVLFLLGVPGAGKDTLVRLVEHLIGPAGLARPSCKEFLELYNGWMLDKYFVQLDEYGNQLTRYDEKEAALGKIKAYTGKSQVQIRQMRTDGFQYIHSITFFMTANKNPLFVEGDDRRMALFDCPNVMGQQAWVQTLGGVAEVQRMLDDEINDFAYYLATEVDNLTADQYTTPPDTADKKKLIASKFGAAQRIAFLLANEMFEDLAELALEYDAPDVLASSAEGRIYEDDLFDLYYEITEGKGTKRGLSACMKEFSKVPTTRNNQKSHYYDIPGLRKYRKPFSSLE